MRAVNLIREEGPAVGMGGRSQGAAAVLLSLIGVLAILAALYGVARHEASSLNVEAAQLGAQAQNAEESAAQLGSFTTFSQLRDQRVQDVSELVETRFDWANALRELGRVLPAGASVASLNGSIAGGEASASTASPPSSTGASSATSGVSSATPAGSVPSFAITGCATSQSEVAETLDRFRLIAGVSEVQLVSSTQSSSSSGDSSGACPAGSPSFDASITFEGLPASVPGPSSGSGEASLAAAGSSKDGVSP